MIRLLNEIKSSFELCLNNLISIRTRLELSNDDQCHGVATFNFIQNTHKSCIKFCESFLQCKFLNFAFPMVFPNKKSFLIPSYELFISGELFNAIGEIVVIFLIFSGGTDQWGKRFPEHYS